MRVCVCILPSGMKSMYLITKIRRMCNIPVLVVLSVLLCVLVKLTGFHNVLLQGTQQQRQLHGSITQANITNDASENRKNLKEQQDISKQSDISDSEEKESSLTNHLDDPQNKSDDIHALVEATQTERQTILNEACTRLGSNRTLPTPKWATTVHFLCNDKQSFIYCFAPKVACTTWKGIMKELYIDELGVQKPKKRFIKMNELLKDPASIVKRWTTYKKVVFAREPLNRALSAYLDKFVYGPEKPNWEKKFGTGIVRKYRKNPSTELKKKPFNITFIEFIRYLTDTGPKDTMSQMSDHWLPISSFTHPCRLKFDFIGKYETLADDGPYVLRKFGLDQVVTFPEIHGSHAAELMKRQYANVPENLIRKLQDYYKMDYELFGYSRESVLETVLSYQNGSRGK